MEAKQARLKQFWRTLTSSILAVTLASIAIVVSNSTQAVAAPEAIKQELILTVQLPQGQDDFALPTGQTMSIYGQPIPYDWKVSHSTDDGSSWSTPQLFAGNSSQSASPSVACW